MVIKRCIPIILILLIVTACNTFADTSDVVLEGTSQEVEAVAQVTTDVPLEEPTTETVVIEPTDAPVIAQATTIPPTLIPTSEPETASYNAPAWVNLPLTNAQTGETFTLADLAGKTVFIEPMATWCPNCRTQQGYVAQAMQQVNADDFVFISLSVGENVSNQTLANYATNNNFPQIFVVASSDLINALVQDFGFTITSPPSTPHFTISPIGTVSSLSTGYHQAGALVEELMTAQSS